jgi:hypothetical protein
VLNSSAPITLTLTDTTLTTLVPGQTNKSVYVTALAVSNTSSTLTRLDVFDGATLKFSMGLAANGGGYIFKFDPVWALSTGANLRVQLSGSVTDVRVNVNSYVA